MSNMSLPEHWKIEKLGQLCRVFSGYGFKTKDYTKEGIPLIKIGNLQDGEVVINPDNDYMPESWQENRKLQKFILKSRDILIALTGATTGKTAVVPPSLRGAFLNQRVGKIELVSPNAEQDFILVVIKTRFFQEAIQQDILRSAQGNVSPSSIAQISIPLPPIPAQRKIANFLEQKTQQINELIRIKERRIELLQEQRTALINQAVTKELDPNVEMKPSGIEWIGDIPKHWKIEKIKYIATFVSEKSTPETDAIKISPENVESETGKVLDFYSSYDAVGVRFQAGDVLFNKLRVYLNKVVFAEYDGYSLGEMIVIRPSLQDMGKYLFYLMLSSRFIEYCNSISYGVKMPRTAVEDILNTQIPIPLPQEQTQIANFLDHKTKQIDELISTEQRKIELLKEYRQSLISEMVTGKIDVRNEV